MLIAPRVLCLLLLMYCVLGLAQAGHVKTVTNDYQIDAVDPGIKLFVRQKMAEGNTRFTDATS